MNFYLYFIVNRNGVFGAVEDVDGEIVAERVSPSTGIRWGMAQARFAHADLIESFDSGTVEFCLTMTDAANKYGEMTHV